jgi:hypothetical protein
MSLFRSSEGAAHHHIAGAQAIQLSAQAAQILQARRSRDFFLAASRITSAAPSATVWPQSTARRCLAGLVRRWYAVAVWAEVFAEYEAVAAESVISLKIVCANRGATA